jgi:hypothetical protein
MEQDNVTFRVVGGRGEEITSLAEQEQMANNKSHD